MKKGFWREIDENGSIGFETLSRLRLHDCPGDQRSVRGIAGDDGCPRTLIGQQPSASGWRHDPQ